MSLSNKVAIVTGAGSGIGATIAEKFSNEGAHVVLVDRDTIKVNAVAARCNDPLIVTAELGKEEDIERTVEETIKKYGRIDVLVNNAGTSVNGSVLVGDLLKAHDEVMKINFRAVVHFTKLVAPHLIETKGNIINISSVSGQRPARLPILMMYAVSKAAVDHFCKCVAIEMAPHKVRVNNISPGPVRTDILLNTDTPVTWDDFRKRTALDRLSEPQEIADIALFLASDKAKGVTGSIYVADNGVLLH